MPSDYSVSQLHKYLQEWFKRNNKSPELSGKVQNFAKFRSGYAFDLTYNRHSIHCYVPEKVLKQVPFQVKANPSIAIRGQLQVWGVLARLQLRVMQPDGLRDLSRAAEGQYTAQDYIQGLKTAFDKRTDHAIAQGVVQNLKSSSKLRCNYFDLMVGNDLMRCLISHEQRLDFKLQNDQEIRVAGHLRIWPQEGRIQLEAQQATFISVMPPSVRGEILSRLDELGLAPKAKLTELPNIRRIGLVTGGKSDAYQDFTQIYKRNKGKAEIIHHDVRVQGQHAVKDILQGIERFNSEKSVDVIVITRGGGRALDLDTFNHPDLVVAVAASEIPVMTAIGHAGDRLLVDEFSDLSADTPSDAAYRLAGSSS